MALLMNKHDQSGSVLLEVLVSVVIFAVGILGLIGLQATAIKQSTDAQYRSNAAMLANKLLGEMWVGAANNAALQSGFAKGGARYNAWRDSDVKALLPGVVNNTPTEPNVTVAADGTVTITIRWHPPSDPSTGPSYHEYVTVARVVRN